MRSSGVSVLLIAMGAFDVPSFASEVSIGRHSADEVKRVCEKVGGRFSQDATGHYCGTDCHGGPGTDCTVGCKNGQACIAQVIGARRPNTLGNALEIPSGSRRK